MNSGLGSNPEERQNGAGEGWPRSDGEGSLAWALGQPMSRADRTAADNKGVWRGEDVGLGLKGQV